MASYERSKGDHRHYRGGLEEPYSFVDAWHLAEQGSKSEALELLTFEDMETFLRVMTVTRWALLRTLHEAGPLSVRALAKKLGRDYKNVHKDVGLLERVGLVARAKDKRLVVPWDAVVAELDLKAA